MEKQFAEIMEAIAETLREFLAVRAAQYELVNGGTLKNSKAYNNIKVTVEGFQIRLEGPGYIKYIQSGRKRGALKGVRLPIEVLVNWLKKKGVGGELNPIAWAIQQSIYKNGIKTPTKPRPFVDDAIEDTAKELDEVLALNLQPILINIFSN